MKTIFLLAIIFLSACAAQRPSDTELRAIHDPYERWRAADIQDYDYIMQSLSFAFPGKIFVRVRVNKISEAFDQTKNRAIAEEEFSARNIYIFDSLFAHIKINNAGNPYIHELRYDSTYGFPRYEMIDRQPDRTDDYWGYEIIFFEPK